MVKEESCSFFALLSLYMGREVLEPWWWKAIPLAAAKVWYPEVLLYVSYVHHFLKRTTGKNGSNRYTTSLPQWQAITQLPIYSWASSSLSTTVQNKGTESSQLEYCWSGRHRCPWEQPHCQISPRSSCWSAQLPFLKYGVGQKVLFEVRSNICSKMLQKIQMNFLANAIFFCCFCLVAQSCLTLCDPTDCSTPDFSVLHQLPELAQTHVHWVGDAIQPPHPLLFPSPPAFNLSQHQGLF